jgi:CDGSH-type Zn-finger protein
MPGTRKITITKDGPYIVSGSTPLSLQTIGVDAEGESTEWVRGESLSAGETYALCRCGESKTKPFCDGSHAKVGFDGTETASREPVVEQAQLLEGPSMRLADAEVLCAFARFCDPNGRIWNQVEETGDPAVRANFVRQAGDCPSGRLIAIDKATGKAVEPNLPKEIGIVEDPARECSGPLWARGGIPLVGADGKAYEVRNRMTLCRCGRSENKPFCNGAHAAEPAFRDGLK